MKNICSQGGYFDTVSGGYIINHIDLYMFRDYQGVRH